MRARSCSLVCLSLQPLWTHTQAPLMVEAGPLELAATRAAALTRDVGSEDRTSYVASDAAGKSSAAGTGSGSGKFSIGGKLVMPFSIGMLFSSSPRAVHPAPDAEADAEAQAAASAVESKRLEQQRGKSIQKERWQKASASSMTHARRVKRLQVRAAPRRARRAPPCPATPGWSLFARCCPLFLPSLLFAQSVQSEVRKGSSAQRKQYGTVLSLSVQVLPEVREFIRDTKRQE